MVISQQVRALFLPVLFCLFLSFVLWALVLPAGLVYSGEFPFEPGFKGAIQPGVAVVSTESLDNVDDDNRRINSLDQDPDSETEIVPILLWEMTYTMENGRTQFFAGTPEDSMVDGAFLLEAGVRHALEDNTILFAAVTPGIPLAEDEVWSDPFLTGAGRSETDREVSAFRLGASDIMGTRLFFSYGFADQDIDRETAGQYLVNQGSLTSAQAATLNRDAQFHWLEAGLVLPATPTLVVIPTAHYMRGDADGEANSFDNCGAALTLTVPTESYEFFTSASLDFLDYGAIHPVFNKAREDLKFTLSAGVTIPRLLGHDALSLTLLAAWSEQDSNIHYYDSSDLLAGMALAWHF